MLTLGPTLHLFNNQKPSGAVIEPLLIVPTDQIADDLGIRVQDA